MTETKPLPPLEIVGERFTIRHFAGTETLQVAKDVDGDLAFHADHDGTVVMIAAADVPRFIDALDRLTGGGHRRAVLKEAAREFDCCGTCGGELHECAAPNCGGKVAAAICALAEEE